MKKTSRRPLKPLNYILLITWMSVCSASYGQEQNRWSIKPYFGVSRLADTSAQYRDIGGADELARVNLDDGFVAGLSLAYFVSKSWQAEIAWEYRSNDSNVRFSNGEQFTEGNYASNTFFVNGIYHLDVESRVQPYFGVGLSWMQEVDIDLESEGLERSYSSDGDIGFNVFSGLSYPISTQWSWDAQLRYSAVSGIDMSREASALERFEGLDYEALSVQVGLAFTF